MTRSTLVPKETFVQIDSSEAGTPCLTCGACCAYYRASFHWTEADDAGGTVPVGSTEDFDAFRRAMKGTNQPNPRCVALDGEIGVRVACSIYGARSSVCREFPPAWQNGEPNEKCDRARIAWGLEPIPASVKGETGLGLDGLAVAVPPTASKLGVLLSECD